jgi:membrane carboxypeptidase/penicillin-binding protein
MRRILLITVFLTVLGAATVPVLYFIYARDLPSLADHEAIRFALASKVESERTVTADIARGHKIDKFEILPREKLPKGLVEGLLAMEACPEYFGVPKEPRTELAKRLIQRLSNPSGGEPGAGRCQVRFADHIAETIGVADPIHFAIADDKILQVLSIEELIVYRLAGTWYAEGIIGTRDACKRIFGLEPGQLDLAQVAELLAAESYFPEFAGCKNPARLKLLRDAVLDRMEAFNAISAADAKRARARKVSCSSRPY